MTPSVPDLKINSHGLMRRLVKSEMHILRRRRLAGCRRNILFFRMMKMMEKLAKSPTTMIRASTANATKQYVNRWKS